jgi:hypothetical protein
MESASCRAVSGEVSSDTISINKLTILGNARFLFHCVGCSDTKATRKRYIFHLLLRPEQRNKSLLFPLRRRKIV